MDTINLDNVLPDSGGNQNKSSLIRRLYEQGHISFDEVLLLAEKEILVQTVPYYPSYPIPNPLPYPYPTYPNPLSPTWITSQPTTGTELNTLNK